MGFGRRGLLAIAAVYCIITGCLGESGCANTEQTRVHSPNGAFDVVVFVRDCGATTDYSAQVALVPAGAPVADAPGNVFIDAHQVAVAVRWLGSDTLEVRHPNGSPVLSATQVGGVTITYAGTR